MKNSDNKIKSNDRFVRWQGTLRDQLTFLNNILLTIAIGIIGFCISLLSKENFYTFGYSKMFFTLGLIMIILSIFAGLVTSFSRLRDLRKTVKKIKKEFENPSFDELSEVKELIKLYEKITWNSFYLQMATFSIGVLSLLLAFGGIYYDKLF